MTNPQPAGPAAVVSARNLTKVYRRGREQVCALDQVSFEILSGEFVAVVGPSGAGKTTLLNLIGCMDPPSSGELRLDDRRVQDLAERDLTRLRCDRIGFVFQHFSLVPTLTVAENVALPSLFARRHAGPRLDELLDKVGLSHRRAHRPHQLSGGEMQRAALARALINQPRLVLADEPTGNLDSATAETILQLFAKLHAEGLTLIVVTHNPGLAALAQRRLELLDGHLAGS